MDGLCKSMADVLETLNDASGEKKGIQQNALARMRKEGHTEYSAHGVRFTKVHGDDKVLVKLVDDDKGGEAETTAAEQPAGDAGGGDGREAGE